MLEGSKGLWYSMVEVPCVNENRLRGEGGLGGPQWPDRTKAQKFFDLKNQLVLDPKDQLII